MTQRLKRLTDPRKVRRIAWRALKSNAYLTKKYNRRDPETQAMRVAVLKVTKRSLARYATREVAK